MGLLDIFGGKGGGGGAPREVDPYKTPSFGDLSMQEKLFALSAVLSGDPETALKIPQLAQKRALQQQARRTEQSLAADVAGVPQIRSPIKSAAPGESGVMQFETQDVIDPNAPRGMPSLRDMLPKLARATAQGVDTGAYLEMLKAGQPKAMNVNGLILDENDPKSIGRFVPSLEKGQELLFDADGRVKAIRNMDGSVQSAAEMAAATEEAKARVGAKYDIGKYDMPDGSTQQIPRLQAVEAMSGGAGAAPVPPVGVPATAGPAPGVPAGLGRSQTPADKVRAEGRAKTEVEVEALTPKAKSTLETLDRKTDFVLAKLREARRQISDGPGGTTGLNDLTKFIPMTASRNLDKDLDTVRAAVGFDELQQMRDNSPTGGAVGSLTERELALLSSLKGSLDQGQAGEELRKSIDGMIVELEKVTKERRGAFQRQYGAARPAASATRTQITPEQARAELARRRGTRSQ